MKGENDMTLKGRSFLTLLDFTPAEIAELLALAAKLKAEKKAGISHRLPEGKNVALIFEKTSTRTRCRAVAHDFNPFCRFANSSMQRTISRCDALAGRASCVTEIPAARNSRGHFQ